MKKEGPELVFLMETKLSRERMLKIRDGLEEKQGVAVEYKGRSGGLALLWSTDMDVTLNSMSDKRVDVIVCKKECPKAWYFTGF